MKRITAKIESLAINERGEIEITNKHIMNEQILFINPKNVKWYYENHLGQTEPRKLQVGSIIEFDSDIGSATRNLHNVVIIKQYDL